MRDVSFEISIPLDSDGYIEMECDYCKNRFMLHHQVYESEDNINFFALFAVCQIEQIHFCAGSIREGSANCIKLYV